MFQPEWAQKDIWRRENSPRDAFQSSLERDRVRETLLLHWEEHCNECAPSQCYRNCPLYLERKDKKCANFLYGIYRNQDFFGLFDFGADIRFRRWSKLETIIYERKLSISQHCAWQNINCAVAGVISTISNIIQPISPRRRLNGALSLLRNLLFSHLSDKDSGNNFCFDEFVLEAFLPLAEPAVKLIIEYSIADRTRYRHALTLSAGHNFYTIPVSNFNFPLRPPWGIVKVYPEENIQPRVIFTWLDFVRYKKIISQEDNHALKPALKIKCVAWDLDNTLWEGTLTEDGPAALKPNPYAVNLIKQLDERGILQTIVSKNDFDEAWAVVESLGLKDYFLYPSINWGQKSRKIEEVAKKLNMDIDTFALIDDSPFERAEVHSALPQVRTYSNEEINTILTREEFDVPITEASQMRRLSYAAEVKRERVKADFSGGYDNFLRSCEMKLNIFVPREERHIVRCLELIQRSHQLNLSGRLYTREEFDELLRKGGVLCVALACLDKFGDYGIIGFISIDETKEIPTVKDFVISCRIAQKKVEHTFFKWLAFREAKKGKSVIRAELIKGKRNNVLFEVFRNISFQVIKEVKGYFLMELPIDTALRVVDVMTVEANIPC